MNKIRLLWESGRVRLLTPNGAALYAALCLDSKWRIRVHATNRILDFAVLEMKHSSGLDIELTVHYWCGVTTTRWYGSGNIKFSFLDWCLLQKHSYKLYKQLLKADKKKGYQNNNFIEVCTKAAVTGDIK